MTKIDIISGFLGAGKTTLIKKLLTEAFKDEQVVLIENEFGEIGIDGGFLENTGIEIKEMISGCICCSLVGDFGNALKEVIETYHPARIIIEPSGVGKLSDVIKAVQDVDSDEIVLNSYTTVADVNKAKMYLENFGEFFSNQLQFARAVVLSRTDTEKATPAKVQTVVDMIRELNPNAAVITTPIDKLDAAQIVKTMEMGRDDEAEMLAQAREEAAKHAHHHHHHHEDGEECHCHDHDHEHEEHEHHHHHEDGEECFCHDHDHEHEEHEHHHHEDGEECHCHDHDHEHEHHHHHDHDCGCGHDHDADEVFTSWGGETARKYTKEEITNILKALSETKDYGTILRAKGWVDGADGQWIYFDMVPEEYEVRDGQAQVTGRFCVIGADLKEDKLKALFA